jgi:hypothetical protein
MFPQPIPDVVAEWFSWCDGISDAVGLLPDDAAALPSYWPLSIDEALSIREDYIDDPPALGDHWQALLGNGGGDFYAAVHDADLSNVRVFRVVIGGDVEYVYDSVEHMVDGITEMYRTGVFFVNDEGRLDADYQRWADFEAMAGGADVGGQA